MKRKKNLDWLSYDEKRKRRDSKKNPLKLVKKPMKKYVRTWKINGKDLGGNKRERKKTRDSVEELGQRKKLIIKILTFTTVLKKWKV